MRSSLHHYQSFHPLYPVPHSPPNLIRPSHLNFLLLLFFSFRSFHTLSFSHHHHRQKIKTTLSLGFYLLLLLQAIYFSSPSKPLLIYPPCHSHLILCSRKLHVDFTSLPSRVSSFGDLGFFEAFSRFCRVVNGENFSWSGEPVWSYRCAYCGGWR
jgi:hypothetical protein